MRSRITSYKQIMHILKTRLREGKFYEGEIGFDSLFGKYFMFRGQAYSNWRLLPRAVRGQELTYDELDLTDNSRTGIFAQMYSKSARVIDFTSDLKLALYYACSDEQYKDKDGALIVHLANPWDLNAIGSAIAKYIAKKDFPHRYPVVEMAYEIAMMDEVQRNLQLDGFPDECTIEYICLLIHQFLRYGTMIFFDKSIYEKYPKIKKERGAIYYCGSKMYQQRKKPLKDLQAVMERGRSSLPSYRLHTLCHYARYHDHFVIYRIASEAKQSILDEIYNDVKDMI